MPPVEVVVHSVALLPLAAVVPPVAVVYRPSPLSCRPSKLIVKSSGVALLSLSLSPLVRRRPPPSYRAAAASLLIVVPPPPSVDCRVIRPARRRRCAACCPAAPCRNHASRRSRCEFCRPAAPCRCRAARHRRVPPVAIVVPLIEVDCQVIGRCPPLFVAVAARPPPPAAASLFIVALPLPSLSCRWFCFRRCATAAILEAMSAVDGCCVTPKFAMIFLSAVTVKLRPFLPVRVPPHAYNSSPASPASATRIWMIVE
jgi:hypothetical protein